MSAQSWYISLYWAWGQRSVTTLSIESMVCKAVYSSATAVEEGKRETETAPQTGLFSSRVPVTQVENRCASGREGGRGRKRTDIRS